MKIDFTTKVAPPSDARIDLGARVQQELQTKSVSPKQAAELKSMLKQLKSGVLSKGDLQKLDKALAAIRKKNGRPAKSTALRDTIEDRQTYQSPLFVGKETGLFKKPSVTLQSAKDDGKVLTVKIPLASKQEVDELLAHFDGLSREDAASFANALDEIQTIGNDKRSSTVGVRAASAIILVGLALALYGTLAALPAVGAGAIGVLYMRHNKGKLIAQLTEHKEALDENIQWAVAEALRTAGAQNASEES